MLIVRGVNIFPSAIREVVNEFSPQVSGYILVRPQSAGVKQEPPLPVSVELAREASADDELAQAIARRCVKPSPSRRASSSSRGEA